MVDTQTRFNSLALTAFTADLVAKLTGLSVSRLYRWDRSGFFQPSLADPNRRRPHSRIYSLPDVVALRAVAALRAADVSFAELETMRSSLYPDEEGTYPTRCLFVVDRRWFRSWDDAIAAAAASDPPREPTTIDLDAIVAEVEESVRRLSERTPDQIGRVMRNHWIMNGAPVIAGTRIPTATIVWAHQHGYSVERIIQELPRLRAEDIQAAIDFEQHRAVTSSDPALVSG